MSKKRKRQIRSEASLEKRGSLASSSFSRSLREEFNPDYSHVLKDLRRIAILAGTFLTILIVLSFFLR
jgi:hypothetical protein